jgi:hypothetical protein
MVKILKIGGGFAAVGFVLPLLILGYSISMRYIGKYPNVDFLFYLCPSSILCLGLDKASMSTAVFVWLIIAASNSVVYALLGAVVALILGFRNSKLKPS